MDEILFLMMIIIIWVVYYILIYINNKTLSRKPKNYDSLVIVHQNCYSFNAQHIYLIKVFYGKPQKKFFFWTNIVMDFLNDRNETYSTVRIPPRVLLESQKHSYSEKRRKKEKFMAFILQTKTSLEQTRSIRLKHDNRLAEIFIYRIKIIDLISKDSFNVMVNSNIKFLAPGAHPRAQTYNCISGIKNRTDIKPSPYLNFANILLFFFFGIHAIMFHIQYKIIDVLVLGIVKTDKDYHSLFNVCLSTLLSASFASLLVLILLLFYYLVVKHFYSKYRGIGCIWVLETVYRWTVVIIAISLGLLAAIRRQIHLPNKFKESDDRNKIKLIALALAIMLYSITFFTIGLISQYFGLMKAPIEYDLESSDEISSKTDKLAEQPVVRSESNMTNLIGSSNNL